MRGGGGGDNKTKAIRQTMPGMKTEKPFLEFLLCYLLQKNHTTFQSLLKNQN